ncbi:hypothetical protein K6U06_22270 [Acidiferrimicrobium sp. IK]|uniref:hypothetical protein n=1 Tax=Acidiferrimicrobium sp. IK TaxID=2871700 RepID=UPI0021CB489E|nr:hypothetical protein [Acidiferrimicrobium sp. IK]MCU4187104.1 hypothetical protein [Acidiferrimicrobium sp. IK]
MALVQRRAARQRMLITVAQLEALGMGENARRHAVAAGDLVRRGRTVLALPGASRTWEDDVLAAVLTAGPGAAASHSSALRLWDLHDGVALYPCPELTAPRRRRVPGVRVYQRPLPPAEVTQRAGVPVTTVSRTMLDLSPRLGAGAMGGLVDEALRRRVVSLRELSRVVEAVVDGAGRARDGARLLREVLAERSGEPERGANGWEQRMDRAWDRMGLPPAARQYWIDTPYGAYRVDRAIVELKIAVEWNGFEYHGLRSRFDRDSDRRGHLVAAGWIVLDFTSNSTPEHIVATVQAAVAQRRRELGSRAG